MEQFAEKSVQHLSLWFAEPAEQVGVDGSGVVAQHSEHALPGRREREGVPTAVGRIGVPLHVPQLMQQVDHRRGIAGVNAVQLTESLLVRGLLVLEDHQHTEVVRGQPVPGEHARPASARLGAKSNEQVTGTGSLR